MSNLLRSLLLMLFQKLNFYIEYLFKNGLNEKKLYLEKINKEKVIVFDIGSNLGNYSKFVSKIFSNKEIYIHSFEPIKNLLKKQKIKHGTVIKNNVAVSKNPGTVKFYERAISSQSSLYENSNLDNDKTVNTYDVETINLVDYIKEHNISNVDILKIDVEGKELDILRSLENNFYNLNISIIKIETTFHGHSENAFSNLLEIYEILNSNNYEFAGSTNTKYLDNKIFFSDSYFVKKT